LKQDARIDGIYLGSFSPSITIRELQHTNCRDVPIGKGVYLIIRHSLNRPEFLRKSVGGWYKKLDPSYPLKFVVSQWVDGACLLYVGKANGKKGIRQRLRQFIQFGLGKPVGHRGGRLIWHLKDYPDMLVHWLETAWRDPDQVETTLIKAFRKVHGRRPFANLQK
jgi:hypothetical protein